MTCSKQCPDSSVGLGLKKKKLFLLSLLLWSNNYIRGWTGSSTFDWPDFGETGVHSSGIYLLIDEVLCKSLGPE